MCPGLCRGKTIGEITVCQKMCVVLLGHFEIRASSSESLANGLASHTYFSIVFLLFIYQSVCHAGPL